MFEAWGHALFRRRRLTLAVTLLFVAFAAVWGTGVFGQLSSGDNFTPPSSPSQQEANRADQVFGRNDADVVVLYRSATMTVTDPAYRQAVTAALAGLPHADVARVTTYWSTGSPTLVSTDKHSTYAVLQLTGADDAARHTTYNAIKAELTSPGDGISAQVGGNVPLEVAINNEVSADIAKAEGFSMPVLLILLLIIFGSLAAASLPLAIGGVGILGSFTVLRLLTMGTTVSIYSVNITTILGLGLGIDYGLFMVTRFREELDRQPTVEQAVARTVATAGRTVAVSGVTVAVALTSLMLFPEDFLRSMGYGGVATVAVDVVAALTVMPALLAVLGHRVNALRIRRSVRRPVMDEANGAWYRLAHSVMRRPLVYVTVITIALLALGAPFLRISWGGTDARTLPAASTIRQVSDTLDSQFPVNSTAPIEALLTGPAATSPAQLGAYTQWGHLSRLLQFTSTGSIDPTMPILMLAIIFGLSMDYEVFLLSRIRERYDQTGDNTAAVAAGLQRTGGVITSLALLLIIVVGAFSASGITFIKLMGVGMIVALLVDASVVRVLLVPATMRLLGRANWWAPRPLRGLYARYGIKEDGQAPVPVPAAAEG